MLRIKRRAQVLLSVLLALSLASCSAGKTPAPQEQTSAAEPETTEAQAAAGSPQETETQLLTAEALSQAGETQSPEEAPAEQPTEPQSAFSAPTEKAEIIRLYNDAVNRAFTQKASFTKWRKTTVADKDYKASPVLEKFKGKVMEFMGVNDGTQTKVTAKTEDYDHYLQRASLRESDVDRASCVVDSNGNVQIALNIRSGSSLASRKEDVCDAPLDRSGIAVGDADKQYWDHKTAQNVYHALKSYSPTATVDERYDNAVITASVTQDGALREMNIQFNIMFDLSDSFGVGGSAKGTAEIRYSDFKA